MKEKAIEEFNETLDAMRGKDDSYKLGALVRLTSSLCGFLGMDEMQAKMQLEKVILFEEKGEYHE